MGIDALASIGYGFKLPKSFADEHEDGDSDPLFNILDPGLSIMSSGDEGYLNYYVVIKKSLIEALHEESGKKLNIEKLLLLNSNSPHWNEVLKKWAKKNKITNIKINWYLCCSMC
jgi:hypothetical protein